MRYDFDELLDDIVLTQAKLVSREIRESPNELLPGVKIASVVSILYVPGRRIPLVLEIKNKIPRWGFPGGGPQNGESLEETAMRELSEEVGIRIRLTRRNLLKRVPAVSRMGEEPAEILVYRARVHRAFPLKTGPDQLEAQYFTPDEIDALVRDRKMFANHATIWRTVRRSA